MRGRLQVPLGIWLLPVLLAIAGSASALAGIGDDGPILGLETAAPLEGPLDALAGPALEETAPVDAALGPVADGVAHVGAVQAVDSVGASATAPVAASTEGLTAGLEPALTTVGTMAGAVVGPPLAAAGSGVAPTGPAGASSAGGAETRTGPDEGGEEAGSGAIGTAGTIGLTVGLPLAGVGVTGVVAALRPQWLPQTVVRAFRSPRILRWLGAVPLVGLFSRLRDDELVEQPVRAHLLQILQEHPGATMLELQEKADIAWGTVVYHLDRLEKARHVVSQRDGRSRRYWLEADPEARNRKEASLLRHDTPRSIAAAISDSPGIHQGAVCDQLHLSAPTASKHLKRLAEMGLVRVEPEHKRRLYYPTERLQALGSTAA